MKTYRLPHTELEISRLAYGCMNLGGRWDRKPLEAAEIAHAARLVETACELGINFFDHADIYTLGKSEQVFGEVLRQQPGLRQRIIIQSKCGIRFAGDPQPGLPGRYDFSHTHIISSVEGSLKRLGTDHLDILLLHRPDALVEPEEVGSAFNDLRNSGKVRYFGVSNHTAAQMALLQKYIDQPLVANQVELNLLHAHLIEDGVRADIPGAYAGVGGTLDYCRLNQILIQAWAPVAGGRLFNLPAEAKENERQAAALIAQLADEKRTSREAILLGWLLRHPAGIQPVIGTTSLERLKASCLADEVTLSREEWYALLVTARGAALP